ncbi:MAG TPA: GTP 3',8-cyclase MoaA [Gemmatimonadales bacterium]|nr:GTP 3',8-cyclase MoaA [Gemmatimonadales bacterium]
MSAVRDRLGRPLGSLRISVTDRCNLRCRYCMPEEEYTWLPRTSLLAFEEIERLASAFARLGVRKIRLTGGEPLLRRDLSRLVRGLVGVPGIEEVALTTNGLLLAGQAALLRAAGLHRVTVSLDTLRQERMAEFAKSAHHGDALAGIATALQSDFASVKLNTVVVRGYNDDELVDLTRFAVRAGIEPRFIEYMDVGGATDWRVEQVFDREAILARLAEAFGAFEAVPRDDDPRAPAERFRFADGTVVGIIASTTAPFCRDCDRARLTADGVFYRCLYAQDGIDLRTPLRAGASDDDLDALLRSAWEERADRGAELRAAMPARGVLVPLEGLRADPRKEMHTRGG